MGRRSSSTGGDRRRASRRTDGQAQRARRIRVAVTGILAVVMAAAVIAAVSLGNRNRSAAAAATTGPPLLAPTGHLDGTSVDGITADPVERVAFHIHAHLQIYVSGQQRAIPGGIGIVPPYQIQPGADGPFVPGGTAFYWLHTHDRTGVIHIESPVRRAYTLGEFFDLWGQPLGADQVGPAHGVVIAVVNGTRFSSDPRGIPLHAHNVIQLSVGPAVTLHPYVFPQGL
jgi:hypothetical protein